MLLQDLSPQALAHSLATTGLVVELGAATVRVIADVAGLPESIRCVYGAYPAAHSDQFCDATIRICRSRGLRRLLYPQIEFIVESSNPFYPFPADTHLPLMEWGLNHALAERLSHYLLLHSGSLARGASGLLLPAEPGSGKSTLTAALMTSGYRLLSDEFGVVDQESGDLIPMVRPVALKNESIDVIRGIAPDAVFGPAFPKTRKGTVAHLAPTRASIEARNATVTPRVVAFPKYLKGSPCRLEMVEPGVAFNKLAVNSFNYEFLGPKAFDSVARLVKGCSFWRLTYGDISDAIAAIDDLISRAEAEALQ